MDDLLKLAFDNFHSEMDVVLGAPWAFSTAILVIAAIEYLVIRSLQQERFQAQNARIEFLTHTLARFESKPREMPAEARVADAGVLERAVASPQQSSAKMFASESSEIIPRRLEEPVEVLEPHIQETAVPQSKPHPVTAEPPAHKPSLPEKDSSLASPSPRRLDLSILNVHDGSRVTPIVEVEVLATIAMDRLQAWVFSAHSRQWLPQQPFWRNQGVLIATCRFGDELSRPGDEFRVIIIETEKPLPGPLAALPRDVAWTKPLTVYRG